VALIFDGADGVEDDGVSQDLEVEKVVEGRPVELLGRVGEFFEALEVVADVSGLGQAWISAVKFTVVPEAQLNTELLKHTGSPPF